MFKYHWMSFNITCDKKKNILFSSMNVYFATICIKRYVSISILIKLCTHWDGIPAYTRILSVQRKKMGTSLVLT